MTTAIDHDGLSPPDTKAGRLQRAVLDLLRRHEAEDTVPTNVRFLFYELEQAGVLPKAYRNGDGSKRARQPPQDISDAAMRLREIGLVPWEWLIDETRDVSERRYAASAYEYVVDTLPMIRIDCWGGEPPPLVICEARSTRGVLERIATDEYLCPITATGGQCGGHIVNEVAPLLADDRKVLYLGDCEVGGPGDDIEANTRRYIEQYTGRTFTDETWIKSRSRPRRSRAVRACAAWPSTSSTVATVRRVPTAPSSAKRSDRPRLSGCCATCSTR